MSLCVFFPSNCGRQSLINVWYVFDAQVEVTQDVPEGGHVGDARCGGGGRVAAGRGEAGVDGAGEGHHEVEDVRVQVGDLLSGKTKS